MRIGLNAGFGAPIGSPDLDRIGIFADVIRQEFRLDVGTTEVERTALIDEFVGCPIEPLFLVHDLRTAIWLQRQATARLGTRWMMELYNEPHFWMLPETYAAHVRQVSRTQPVGVRLYAGAIANPAKVNLTWLRRVLALIPRPIGVSIHRYARGRHQNPMTPREGFSTRSQECQHLLDVIGTRPLACTELGFSVEPTGWWLWRHGLDDHEVAARAEQELVWWRVVLGAEVACWYQWRDGPRPDWGVKDHDDRLKPVADILRRFKSHSAAF